MSPFIAGDWGTSHLRLSLCDSAGVVIETRNGRGVSTLDRHLAEEFSALTADWTDRFGKLPAVLCGMAGSTLGWRDVPYLHCPARPISIADGALIFEDDGRRIAIAPGLSCRNRLMAPDAMRGEETQILGAVKIEPKLTQGLHIVCLPGTHTKWVILCDGVIESFLTGLTGELFDVLRAHSVLAREAADPVASKAFMIALEQTTLHPDAELIHLLFETRARQLAGELAARDAASYLSGLIIGQDVAGALRLFKSDLIEARIALIGTKQLCELYTAAFAKRGLTVKAIDGASASLAGLKALHDALFVESIAHAS
jgi:2-dehydro-3-deoxygalactonokinase